MKLIRTFATALGTGILAATTGCSLGSTGDDPATYTPAAYGVAGHCYYIDNPAEALALEAAGLCPSGWAPTLMPLAWHEEYAAYYDSPAYYGTYVPVRYRTVYVSHVTVFQTRYRTQISSASSRAVYRSSSGGTVSGSKLGSKVSFGSGRSSASSLVKSGTSTRTGAKTGTTKYGGGSGRSKSYGGGSGRGH